MSYTYFILILLALHTAFRGRVSRVDHCAFNIYVSAGRIGDTLITKFERNSYCFDEGQLSYKPYDIFKKNAVALHACEYIAEIWLITGLIRQGRQKEWEWQGFPNTHILTASSTASNGTGVDGSTAQRRLQA